MAKILADKMETIIRRQCGVAIELTVRTGRQEGWTISGEPAAVDKAVRYVTANRIMVLESTTFDEGLGETFAYLKDGPALEDRQ